MATAITAVATPARRTAACPAALSQRPHTLQIRRHTEVIVHLEEDDGDLLQPVLSALSAHGVRLLAHSLCANRWGRSLMFVADDSPRACLALRNAGLEYRTDSIVFIETDRCPALIPQLGRLVLREGVGVLYSYVSWTEGENLFAVFKTTDDERALRALAA